MPQIYDYPLFRKTNAVNRKSCRSKPYSRFQHCANSVPGICVHNLCSGISVLKLLPFFLVIHHIHRRDLRQMFINIYEQITGVGIKMPVLRRGKHPLILLNRQGGKLIQPLCRQKILYFTHLHLYFHIPCMA